MCGDGHSICGSASAEAAEVIERIVARVKRFFMIDVWDGGLVLRLDRCGLSDGMED